MGKYIISYSEDLVEEFVKEKTQEFKKLLQKNLAGLNKFKKKLNLPKNRLITIECNYKHEAIPEFELGMLHDYCNFIAKREKIKGEEGEYKTIQLSLGK